MPQNNILGNLFKKKLDNGGEAHNANSQTHWQTYQEWGEEMAFKQNGNLMAFKGSLQLVKEHYLKLQKEDEGKIEQDKANAKARIGQIDLDINHSQEDITDLQERIVNHNDKIDILKKEIIDIKANPDELTKDKVSRIGFFIGLIILLMLTIYLFIFYSSASYSALFKTFTLDDIGLANSIFDPHALSIAFNTSWTEFILIQTIPSIFLGLGFLIHKFQEAEGNSKYFKIAVLVFVTFIVDAILAYEITEKIYNINAQNSFGDVPLYSINLAFESIMFWLIIFLGFIVYLIWGFVFDFVMEAYDKLDIVKQAIKARERQIRDVEDKIKTAEEGIEKSNSQIRELKKEKVEQEKIVLGEVCLVNWDKLPKSLHNFTSGWTHWMTKAGIMKEHIDSIWDALEVFSSNSNH